MTGREKTLYAFFFTICLQCKPCIASDYVKRNLSILQCYSHWALLIDIWYFNKTFNYDIIHCALHSAIIFLMSILQFWSWYVNISLNWSDRELQPFNYSNFYLSHDNRQAKRPYKVQCPFYWNRIEKLDVDVDNRPSTD